MHNELEKFISANREAFNGEEPGANVWEYLEKRFVKKEGSLEHFVQANKAAFDNEEPGAQVWANIENKFAKKDSSLEHFVQANKDAFDSGQPSAQVWQNIENKFVRKESTLEQFVKANRDAFDTETPGAQVLSNIEQTIITPKEKKAPVVYRSMVVRALSIAAAVVLVTVSVWYFTTNNKVTKTTIEQPVAQVKNKAVDTPAATNIVSPSVQPSAQDKIAETKPQLNNNSTTTNKDADVSTEDDQTQEIFYYTKLTEVKFRELKKIEKDNPALYHNFAGEIHKLDSAYHGLQAMLKSNTDKEAILNAMITNLKMQTEILSKQLYIIHSLKKNKQTANENTDKSI